MSWPAARAALDARMNSLNVAGAKIAWPNMPLAAQTGPYYAVAFLPAAVSPELHGADHESGIYQVSVFVPAGSGIGPALTMAQAVADHFKRQNLSGVSCGVPTIAPPVQESNWLQVPVSIPFVCL